MTQKPNNFGSYLAKLPKTPLTEAVTALYESYFGPWNFKSVQKLRDFVDQKTYDRFKLYSKQETAEGKTPFGSLEAIKAIDMDTFLKSVGDKGYDIEDDMKNQLVDANYINNLSYDWFICLLNMKVLGWNSKTEPITEAVEPMTFSTLEELRDYLDRAAYGTFENSEYDQYEQEPYGSLENIQEVSMEDFVKDMSEMNHDIQSLVGQPIDDNTLNQLVYDWFVCLHTRGAVGWQYNWN